MAKFRVLERFKDEDGKIYEAGNSYPMPANKKVSKKRFNELSTEKNKLGRAFIEQLEEEATKDEGE